MYEDFKELIEESELPQTVKLPLSILIRAVSWTIWTFIGVGILLNQEYFIYWLAFFLFVEGVILVSLVYVLILIIRVGLGEVGKEKIPATENIGNSVIKSVIGNIAFYLLFFVLFVVSKAMGYFDAFFEYAKNAVGN